MDYTINIDPRDADFLDIFESGVNDLNKIIRLIDVYECIGGMKAKANAICILHMIFDAEYEDEGVKLYVGPSYRACNDSSLLPL